MIELKNGNFFDYGADIRINTVNCVGAMGAGVALQFKNMFPEMFSEYKDICKKGELFPGKLHIWKSNDIFNPITIINFPTKSDWKNPSEYEYIVMGLDALVVYLKSIDDKIVTLPALGCGHGGLDWTIVKPIILNKLDNINHRILLFEPESSQNIPLYNVESLNKQNIQVIEPDNNTFPKKLKGKTSKSFFYMGDINLLDGDTQILNIISSKNPTEKEKYVLYEILNEIKNFKNIGVLLRGDKSYEIDIVKFCLENDINVLINPSKGLMNFKIRKDLSPLFTNKRHLVYNTLKRPNDNWNISNFSSNFKESLHLSDFTVYNMSDQNEINQSLNKINGHSEIYYINYFNKNISSGQGNLKLIKLGRTKDGKPNVSKLISQ
ncbi:MULTISPECIES: macro domain-containing protein [Sphingobacterium]|uniref:macro domain-containing protein n=1 Tax=Sphingobacterium TaxID=28453 RepID=UPI00257EA447|nr:MULTISPECIES: macro domain-containing protein [Sphingobacterium]